MIRHIHISELKPGMYTVDLGIDWTKRPYLYSMNRMIHTESEIERLVEEGYMEAFVDLARSELPDIATLFPTKVAGAYKPTVALDEEMPAAVKVHGESVTYARRFMTDMRSGKVNVSNATDMVEGIMESLERNADALLTLCRLRRVDTYTHMHCVNVSVLTTVFSRFMGEDSNTVFNAGFSGLFHDLGKALIPQYILNAQRKLTQVEFNSMKRHPIIGHEQLKPVPDIPADVLRGTLEHHEKHDGSGYPNGLSGDAISCIGRMVGVADVYDALSSERPYKQAMSAHKALGIMYQISGKEFHPDYIARFIRMMGVYPVGSIVELEDGWRGVVCASNNETPTKPVVRLIIDPEDRAVPPMDVDLAEGHVAPIAHCLTEEGSGIRAAHVLGIEN